MIVAFHTEPLRRICEDESVARAKLGPLPAAALRERLADLRAAKTIEDLPVGKPKVSGARGELITFELGFGIRMIWTTNHHVSPPTTDQGAVDWSATNRIRLLDFEGA